MRVSRARISGSMLSRLGARWVTMTKAMPGSDGMALNKYSSASTPPAEAPTPTMGNGLSIGSPRSRGNGSACGGRLAPRLRQGPANSKSLCRPCNAIGWFGTRQKPLRSIDRSPCRFDLFAQLQNLAAGGLDQCPRLGHEVAMLGVHRACSRGFERPNELQRMNGYFGSLVAAKTTLSLLVPARGTPRRERRGDPVVFQ